MGERDNGADSSQTAGGFWQLLGTKRGRYSTANHIVSTDDLTIAMRAVETASLKTLNGKTLLGIKRSENSRQSEKKTACNSLILLVALPGIEPGFED